MEGGRELGNLIGVYVTLLVIVVLLLWVGRRFGGKAARGGQGALKQRLVRWMSNGPVDGRSESARQPSVESGLQRSDVNQALAVLDDLYEEFRDETAALRRDFATALDSLRHDIENRMSGIEARQAELQLAVRDNQPDTAEDSPPEVPVEAERTANRPTVNLAVLPKVDRSRSTAPDNDALANLNDAHFEALKRMQAGASAESVARELGIGLGEVAILERMFLTRSHT